MREGASHADKHCGDCGTCRAVLCGAECMGETAGMQDRALTWQEFGQPSVLGMLVPGMPGPYRFPAAGAGGATWGESGYARVMADGSASGMCNLYSVSAAGFWAASASSASCASPALRRGCTAPRLQGRAGLSTCNLGTLSCCLCATGMLARNACLQCNCLQCASSSAVSPPPPGHCVVTETARLYACCVACAVIDGPPIRLLCLPLETLQESWYLKGSTFISSDLTAPYNG